MNVKLCVVVHIVKDAKLNRNPISVLLKRGLRITCISVSLRPPPFWSSLDYL
uniref:Uncharacterized protein n=1 Tax=Anguilla anguilla TaxID=7936 RepID=A0A0E9PHZ1_ANGAN